VRELYVWYHVDARNADQTRAAVESMQRSLERTFPGLRARLLIRRDAERETWMETFARTRATGGADDGIDAGIEAAIAAAAAALRPMLAGDRHVEAFDAIGRAA